MTNCYCPRCSTKQENQIDDPSKIKGHCPKCGRSLLFKMINGEMFVRVKPNVNDKSIIKKNAI